LGNHLSGEAVEHAEALQATWERALLQQLGGADSAGLLLSGGRDSRELAGFLHRNGIPTVALTLGDSRDIEARCASAVASHLGMPHRVRPVGEDNHPWCARQQVRWEHLSTGFGTMHMWDAIPWVRELPDRLVTGYLRGFGENKIHSGIFDSFLAWQNRRGLPAATIRGLFRAPDAGKIVEARLDELRATYMGGGPDPDTQRHRFIMGLRGRFHSGAIPWRLSFGSWPVVPVAGSFSSGASGPELVVGEPRPSPDAHSDRAQRWNHGPH
jgi:asparagine synthase (glutamine-hydrolysing)